MSLYRIGTAARLTGLEVATLRNWEARYGVVVATRGGGRQRLYSREDVERLRLLKRWTESGLSAGEAHNLLRERPLLTRPPATVGGDGESVRREARRIRAEVAATRARAKAERTRAAHTLNSLARR